ncbi:Gfo/Idh/MocA family protein [Sphingosinicella rhizophila]|uniref:Gfo/Idh/MocA family oxidoreductase n=1 Tax=Sphingosinicella rhizophila TaxID=3050082 RepID=A0ABU3Q4Q1_9SPHN|nr:Gfo/Idh/MocA family oxidoreductase [Sphingosinicella sp. GR2756]MDT9598396.1 Gfo/Idh/MocA family oxidoreductase [Sphingosinicella sp. GR2756]
MKPLRIAIIGYGKIARDQHVPAIQANARFALAATVSSKPEPHPGIPSFGTHREMLAAMHDLDAVAICTPPSVRYDIGRDCLLAGKHVLLEKPPAATLGEVEELARVAAARDATLFTTWHAQHAAAVADAARLLAGQKIAAMKIAWREDVRKWHPGQQWIWEPGGFGVFDPGINALSIASHIVPGALFVRDAELLYPENRQTPIAARLNLASPIASGAIEVAFDWRHQAGEMWRIDIRTADGLELRLSEGGAKLTLDGDPVDASGSGEYQSIYNHFVDLIDERRSHVDIEPLRLAAEAFLLGRRTIVEPFVDRVQDV